MLEYKLLGNLLEQGSLGKAKGKLTRQDFLDEKAWRVYRAMHEVEEKMGYFSSVLLNEKLKLGEGYYSHLEKFATVPSDIPHLVRQIKGQTWKREFLRLLDFDRCERCKMPIWESKKLRNMPAEDLREKVLDYATRFPLFSVKNFDMNEALRKVLDSLEGKIEDEMVRTPWEKLNRFIGGITKGKFYIIGGKSSMGKTTMLYNIILSIVHQKNKVLLFQLEGTVEAAIKRMLSILSKVDNKKIWHKSLSDEDLKRIADATVKMSELPIVFSSYYRPNLAQIREEIEIYEPDVVCLDYLQLMDLKDIPGEKKYQKLGYIGNRFAEMCKEYNVAFICLSQLSRGVDHRTPPWPIMSDIRESADLEHASDVIILVNYKYKWRHLYERWQDASPNELHFHVAKNRDGMCSDWIALNFKPEFYFLEDGYE